LKSFSASTVKSWFQYRCERKARYELCSDEELAAVPVVKDVREAAWATLGNEFEERVVQRLAREGGLLLPAPGEKVLSEALTTAFLRGDRPEHLAAQVNLKPSRVPRFLQGTGLDLTRNIADLVRRERMSDGTLRFTVIDIKATRRATAFHKTQVAFYVRVLEERLAEMRLANAVEFDQSGEVWRIPDDGDAQGDRYQAEQFALRPYLRLVDEFCRDVLPTIARKRIGPGGFDETFFHIYFKCEQCAFLDHCAQAIDADRGADRDVSAVPGITHESKRALHRLGVRTVGQLSGARGLALSPGAGWALTRNASKLTARASALATGRIQRTDEQQTFLMPPRADVRLFVSIDFDPIDDRLAAIGYRRVDDGVVSREQCRVPATNSKRDEGEALVDVLGLLIEDLVEIDQVNRKTADGGDEGQAIFAHIFFYEAAEAINLQKAIGRHLDDPRIRGGLLHLVRLFPPEEVVPEPEFRGAHHLPATAVRSVLEQLYALPTAVSYDLRQTSQALAAVGGGPAYLPAPGFERPFSALLSIDVIRGFREAAIGAPTSAAIEADVSARLAALDGVVAWLFAQHADAEGRGVPLLRLNKRPFQFQQSFNPLEAGDLDVLLACELLENRAGLLEALIGLAQPAIRRRDAGRCMTGLRFLGSNAWGRQKLVRFGVPPESRETDIGPSDFRLILTDDSPDLRLDPQSWNLVECRLKPPTDEDPLRPDVVKLLMDREVYDGDLFQQLLRDTAEGGWCLDRPFHDVNTEKAARFLRHLAGSVEP